MATLFSITAGPNRMDFMLSHYDGKRVTFTIEELGEQEALVSGSKMEDGSRESWNMEGYLTKLRLSFKGYFHTKKRSGTITVEGVSRCCTECGEEQAMFGQCKHCQNKRHCPECKEEVIDNDGPHCTNCGAELT